MADAYGRYAAQARLVAAMPYGHWRTTAFVAGLREPGMVAPLAIESPMTARAFLAHGEKVLALALSPGDTMDLKRRVPLSCGKALMDDIGSRHRRATVSW